MGFYDLIGYYSVSIRELTKDAAARSHMSRDFRRYSSERSNRSSPRHLAGVVSKTPKMPSGSPDCGTKMA